MLSGKSHLWSLPHTLWTHLDLDGEGVDEVLWDAVGVSGSVHAHGDELTLLAGNTTALCQ